MKQMPLTAGEATYFKEMIRTVNKAINPPDQKVLKTSFILKNWKLVKR